MNIKPIEQFAEWEAMQYINTFWVRNHESKQMQIARYYVCKRLHEIWHEKCRYPGFWKKAKRDLDFYAKRESKDLAEYGIDLLKAQLLLKEVESL